ncbi:hypothetical protein JNX00_14500 [Hydrogenophaga sp. YM1]|uniref:hypothetical protein n=1 Tax=Hydrogenophaga TaxID=47420 RepID=UPI000A5F2068|nr:MULTISPECIES: hypothetical protein [unclassified Hydrogenophaga]MBN9371472.1 hypothetical protein [Hydrogenophaga sp.]QRR32873.1 hypothetical protein JNX00_14500 [Hydrogenophaga sp. YM1]
MTSVVRVQVIGFSDVERHALNTVFRLSREREVSYGPWRAASGLLEEMPPVLLVDGDCAEAVLVHARAPRPGQRLIWVGEQAPEHAWRVVARPIAWAHLLHDLDTTFAATQSDSGFLDLDVSQPAPLDIELGEFPLVEVRRALVVGIAANESGYLRERLTQAAVPYIDEAPSTERAAECMAQHHYLCGVFNLDDHHIDAWGLMQLFRQRYPEAMTLATSEHAQRFAGPLTGWWHRRRVRAHTRRLGVSGLLALPLQPPVVSRYLEML